MPPELKRSTVNSALASDVFDLTDLVETIKEQMYKKEKDSKREELDNIYRRGKQNDGVREHIIDAYIKHPMFPVHQEFRQLVMPEAASTDKIAYVEGDPEIYLRREAEGKILEKEAIAIEKELEKLERNSKLRLVNQNFKNVFGKFQNPMHSWRFDKDVVHKIKPVDSITAVNNAIFLAAALAAPDPDEG